MTQEKKKNHGTQRQPARSEQGRGGKPQSSLQLREGKANIAESYASDEGDEIWLINSYLPEYLQANRFNHEPRRRRKLLLSSREIGRLRSAINREGMTLVPLKIYFNDRGRAKLELALAKGKKLHDKRESEKERDWNRQKSRLLKDNG